MKSTNEKPKAKTSRSQNGFPTERKSKPQNQPHKYAQDFSEGGKTDRSFGPACDVNTIVRHYEQTGIDPYQSRKQLERFGDATTTSYEEAQRHVAEINSAFELLPAGERAEFKNDPSRWVESLIEAQESVQVTDPDAIAEVGSETDRPAGDLSGVQPVEKPTENAKKDA